jgi:hypothetical protein
VGYYFTDFCNPFYVDVDVMLKFVDISMSELYVRARTVNSCFTLLLSA